jgi:hypothetical protein
VRVALVSREWVESEWRVGRVRFTLKVRETRESRVASLSCSCFGLSRTNSCCSFVLVL